MFFFKTLGILDLFTVIVLAGAAVFPEKFLLYAGIYLIVKGIFFISISRDFASYGDALSGAYILAMLAGIRLPVLNTVVLAWLGQKTFVTFVKIGIETYWLYNFLKHGRKAIEPEPAYYYMR